MAKSVRLTCGSVFLVAVFASNPLFAEQSKNVNVVNTPDVTVTNMPDVNVANSPDVNVANAPDVYVINDGNAPVLTQSVDALARNLFTRGSGVHLFPGDRKKSTAIVKNQDVPVGYVLVIDFVALNLRAQLEQNTVVTLLHWVPGSGEPRILSRSVITPLLQSEADTWYGSDKFMTQIFLEHHPTLSDEEAILIVASDRREISGLTSTDWYVSGHFVRSLP